MLKKLATVILLLLFTHIYTHAGERNLLFVLGRDVEKGEYDIYSTNPTNLTYKKIIDSGINPLWSPDGKKIAFVFHRAIPGKMYSSQTGFRISNQDGGQISNVKQKTFGAEISDFSWSPDGKRVAVATGNWIVINSLDEEIMAYKREAQVMQLDWLRDGERVVFWEPTKGILLLDLRTKEVKLISSDGGFPKIVPGTNKLVYIRKVEKTSSLLTKDLGSGIEEVLATNVLAPFLKKSNIILSGDGRKIFFRRGKDNTQAPDLAVYNVTKKSISFHKDIEGIMEVASYDGNKAAGEFSFEGKGGFGILDLKTGKKSLIKEIKPNELDKRVITMTRLMDW
jgi:Tol biopolymer transport system component